MKAGDVRHGEREGGSGFRFQVSSLSPRRDLVSNTRDTKQAGCNLSVTIANRMDKPLASLKSPLQRSIIGNRGYGVERNGDTINNSNITRGCISQQNPRSKMNKSIFADRLETIFGQALAYSRPVRVTSSKLWLAYADARDFHPVLGRYNALETGAKTADKVQYHPAACVKNRIVITCGMKMLSHQIGVKHRKIGVTAETVAVGQFEKTLWLV